MHLLDIVGKPRIEHIDAALRTADEDFPILRIVVDAEAVQAQHQALHLACASKKVGNILLVLSQLVEHALLVGTTLLGSPESKTTPSIFALFNIFAQAAN